MIKVYSPPMSNFMLAAYSADTIQNAIDLWKGPYPKIRSIGSVFSVICHSEEYISSWVGNVISDTEYKAVTVNTGNILYTLLFAEKIQ